ncbi:MAG: integrase core domain-containing protein [Candidatus Paceibacterota bacterium]
MQKINERELLIFRKLGLEGYIDSMSIKYILPEVTVVPTLSKSAKQRLKWMDYHTQGHTVAQTCRYFGIAPKTFHKWRKIYDPHNLTSLEDRSKRPKKTRQWQITREEERRIVKLRTQYIRYGKIKLAIIYARIYGENTSSWKVQRVIQKHKLYYSPKKNKMTQDKRKRAHIKKRITELTKEPRTGFLIALDTIVINVYGYRRYILTGLDIHNKLAFARMYPGHGSAYAADFLKRIHYLLDGKVENIQTDNGSEFAKYFERAAQSLNLAHYYSRVRTPKDNPFDERFNRTLQDEFIALGHLTNDCAIFNKELTEWLVEYNFNRPHQSLNYLTPIQFESNYSKVLPMYPSSTED